MTITGRKGDITLTLPANAGFQIDANARHGDITTDFSNVKVDKEAGGTSRATGTVGNGAAHLVINSDKGDINISKG